MNKSDSIKELAAALNKAQAAIKPAKKDRENPFFSSSYATLQSVWEAALPAMTTNGLSIAQTFTTPADAATIIVETTLLHTSGEWLTSTLTLKPVKSDPQAFGSAITYGRRYSVAAILGIVADDDDDGNSASHEEAPRYVKPVAHAPVNKCSAEQAAKIHEYCKIAIGAINADKALKKYRAVTIEDLPEDAAAKLISYIQAEMNKAAPSGTSEVQIGK